MKFALMKLTLNIFVVLSFMGGIVCALGASDQRTGSLGAVAGGLFVCLGLCLLSLTMLEISDSKNAR